MVPYAPAAVEPGVWFKRSSGTTGAKCERGDEGGEYTSVTSARSPRTSGCAARSSDADFVRRDIPMLNDRGDAMAALGAAISVLAFPTILGIAPAHGAPGPDICKPATSGDDNACTARLTSVTANSTDGTITGTPVGGGAPVTLWGRSDAYLKSQ